MNAITTMARKMIFAPMMLRFQPGGKKSGKGCFLQCAKCDAPAVIRRSDRPSPVVTQLIGICTDAACGHTFRADIVFVHSLSPGTIDRPDLALPVCPPKDLTHIRPPSEAEPDASEPTFFENA